MEAELTKTRRTTGGGWRRQLFPELCETGRNPGAEILIDAGAFGVSYLFAVTHFAFGVYPFALAYCAAHRRRAVPVFLGAAFGMGTLGRAAPVYLLALLLLFTLRLFFSMPFEKRWIIPKTATLFSEAPELRVSAACLVGLGLAVYEVAVAGVETYTLLFAAAALLAPPLLSFLFSGIYETRVRVQDFFSAVPERGGKLLRRTSPPLASLSVLSLLFVFCYALSGFSLFGLELRTVFLIFAVFFIARRLGPLRAGAAGLLLGLTGGVLYAPGYALLGLISGALFPHGAIYALLLGSSVASAFAAYVGGISGFLSVAPEAAVTALLSWPVLLRLRAATDPAGQELSELRLREATGAAARQDPGTSTRLGRLSTAFSDLSGEFYRLSDVSRRPAAAEYFVECEKVCARHCASCSNRVYCWERGERVAEKAVYALANKLRASGVIGREDLPVELRSGCPKIDTMLEEIRDACADLGMSRYRGDRNEFLSLDYAMLAKILEEAARDDEKEAAEDRDAELRLRQALQNTPLSGAKIAVYGERRRRVAAGSADAAVLQKEAARLHTAAESAVGCRLSEPEFTAKERGGVLTLRGQRRYAVQTASCAIPGSAEENGDRIRFFETGEDCFYAILSDGMGSGEDAAGTAGLSVTFLEKMLSAGNSRTLTLRMLNNLIRTRQNECSASVDMLTFDLLSGSATFVKSGAAPSYIKRGGDIFRVRARTMPIGLMKNLDAEQINVEICPGDIVIMLSDGLAEDGEDPAWLMNLLAGDSGEDLDALARRIIAEACSRMDIGKEAGESGTIMKEKNRKNNTDDTTVGLFRILPLENAR